MPIETQIIFGSVPCIMMTLYFVYYYRPPAMTEVGLRHLRTGFIFAGVSSISLYVASAMSPGFLSDYLLPLFVFGNLCNGISVFNFMRELLLRGEITRGGMFAGILMIMMIL